MQWTTNKALEKLRSCVANGRGNGEGEKAYFYRWQVVFGSCVLQGLADVRGRKPTLGFCGIQRMPVQTSWKQTTVVSPSIPLVILSGRRPLPAPRAARSNRLRNGQSGE